MGVPQLAANRLAPACLELSNRRLVRAVIEWSRVIGLSFPSCSARHTVRRANVVKREIAPPMIA
jgi:hypothetical protein